jgi:hypothetical protein
MIWKRTRWVGVSLCVIAITLLCLNFLLIPGNYGPTPMGRCLSGVKQISIAITIYASDNNDRLPLAATWLDNTRQYIKQDHILLCPKDSPVRNRAYNEHLSELNPWLIDDPYKVPMVFDANAVGAYPAGGKEALSFRHRDYTLVARSDTSAKTYTREQAKDLIWKPKLLQKEEN